jgi:hypothetical protein
VTGPRVLLLTLSERTSGKGNRYLSGWLGKASVVAFAGEPDRHGNPTWDLFVSEPQPRAEAGQERDPARRPQARDAGGPAKPSASPVARGDGWRGSQYRRPANGARRAPVGDDAPFYEDSLEDVGR